MMNPPSIMPSDIRLTGKIGHGGTSLTSHRCRGPLRVLLAGATAAAAAVLACGVQSAPARDLPEIEPGREFSFAWGTLPEDIRVFVPEDYNPERTWPVLFWYPGTGGRPTVSPPREWLSRRGFVIVGMTYIEYDSLLGFVESELASLESVRSHLASTIRIDPQRVYVGGFSRGGWYAGFFADYAMERFAGVLLLGAGIKEYTRPRTNASTTGRPIYVGIGEGDPNYAQAVRAVLHHRKLGHRVTFDAFEGLGHAMPQDGASDRVIDWLAVEAVRGDPAALREAVADWTTRARESLSEIEDPSRRRRFLEAAVTGPWAPHLPADTRQGLERALASLQADPAVRLEREAERSLHNLLEPGWEKLSTDRRQKLEDSLRNHASAFPDTRAGAQALRLIPEIWRMESLVRQSESVQGR